MQVGLSEKVHAAIPQSTSIAGIFNFTVSSLRIPRKSEEMIPRSWSIYETFEMLWLIKRGDFTAADLFLNPIKLTESFIRQA